MIQMGLVFKNSTKVDFQSSTNEIITLQTGSALDHSQNATIVIPLSASDTMAVSKLWIDYYGGHSQWGGCRLVLLITF